jgi:hypothetical protein
VRDLVVRARGGDADAFSELAARSIGRLTAVARLVLRDEYAAQDAVQDALIEAWRSLPGLREPDRFDAWMRRLLVRSCFKGVRHGKRVGAVEVFALPIVIFALGGQLVNPYYADGIGWPGLPDGTGLPMLAIVAGVTVVSAWEIARPFARAGSTRGVKSLLQAARYPHERKLTPPWRSSGRSSNPRASLAEYGNAPTRRAGTSSSTASTRRASGPTRSTRRSSTARTP